MNRVVNDFEPEGLEKAPTHLFSRIVNQIRKEKLRSSLKRTFLFFIVFFGASLGWVISFLALQKSLVQSEFMDLVYVFFTTPAAMLRIWYDFTLALLESLPLGYLVLGSAILFILLMALKYLGRYASRVVSLLKLTTKNSYGYK